MATYTLVAGKTWATGESVTAAKQNTSQTAATIVIAENTIGPASATTNNLVTFNGDQSTGSLIKDSGAIITTTDVSASSTDAQIPTGEAVFDGMVTYVGDTITATGDSASIVVGGTRMKWLTGTGTATEDTQSFTSITGFSSIYSVMVTTDISTASVASQATPHWQLIEITSSTEVKVFHQLSGAPNQVTRPRILVIGAAS